MLTVALLAATMVPGAYRAAGWLCGALVEHWTRAAECRAYAGSLPAIRAECAAELAHWPLGHVWHELPQFAVLVAHHQWSLLSIVALLLVAGLHALHRRLWQWRDTVQVRRFLAERRRQHSVPPLPENVRLCYAK